MPVRARAFLEEGVRLISMESTAVFFTGSSLLLLSLTLWRLFRQRKECLWQSKVIAATGCGVVVTDATAPRHPVIYVNPAFRLLTGYADSDILGQTTAILAGPGTDRASEDKLALALQDGRACRVRLLHYRKNGTPFGNEITLSPVKDRTGRLTSVIWVMSDVTERLQAETILNNSPDPSRTLADRLSDGIIVASESTVNYVNPSGLMLLGADRAEEVIGKPLASFVQADSLALILHQAEADRPDVCIPPTSGRLLRLDGNVVEAHLSSFPILWQGQASSLLLIVRTASTGATVGEAAGRTDTQPESNRAIAHFGSWERDIRTGIEIWSDEQCRIFGFEPGTILPTYDTFKAALHPEDRERVLAAGERSLVSDEPYDVECRIVQPCGIIRFVRCRGMVIRNFAGEPIRISGTVQDKTSGPFIEEVANEGGLPFKLVVESAPNGLLIVGQDGAVSMANAQIEQMFGYSREELLGRPVESLLPACDHSILQIARTESLSASGARSMGIRRELCGLRKDGSEFPVEVALNSVSLASGTSVLAAVIDITDRKNAEAYLHDLSKMEAISTLAGGIVHEVNNSLTAVLGFSHLAIPLIPVDSKAHRYVQQVTSAGLECRELVHELLTFIRQSDQVRRPLSLHLLVKESLKLLRPRIPSWIELEEQIAASTSPVLADPTQMHQMIINLVENGLLAMSKTGGILQLQLQDKEIVTDQMTFSGRLAAGSYACLTVRDSGEGMEPEVAGRVLDPFSTTKPSGDGGGIGLSVVQGIAAMHGGLVVVESQIGTGTVVSVYLPALPPRSTSVPVKGELLPRGHQCILFVDDEESLARFGEEMLVSLGYYPVVRTTAAAAWEAFQIAPQRFDLLIADQTMPDMTGDRLARQCRRLRPDLPVILCAGSEQELSEEQAPLQGITEFMLKPLTLHDVAHRIQRVLDARPTAFPLSPDQPIQTQERSRLLVEESDAISTRR